MCRAMLPVHCFGLSTTRAAGGYTADRCITDLQLSGQVKPPTQIIILYQR
jgi:hypothetical protein